MTAPSRSPLPPAYERLRPPARRKRARRRYLKTVLAVIASVVVVAGALTAWSAIAAYTTPGNESFSAKWTDWLRAHGAGSLVSQFESYYYSAHQPAKGGRPKSLNQVVPAAPAAAPAPVVPVSVAPVPAGLAAPAPVPLIVSPALAGEGQWQPVGPLIHGRPAMYEAQFRADAIYTSEITTAVWIDPTQLRLSLIPGLREPGGSWVHPPFITPGEAPSVVAAFNGGFRFQDAHGGFYLDGRTAVPLVAGAASFVIYKDGRVDIGAWGTEVTMMPDVEAVMQNLVPMVDQGQVAASASYDDHRIWGATINTSTVVARSGIGVTASGGLIYVAGPALTAKTLAESLQRAGAVRAMTLDINPEWVTFNVYSHPDPAQPAVVTGSKLYPQMQRSAERYIGPTQESRDFVEVALPG